MFGLVVKDKHAGQDPQAAACKSHSKEGFFRYSPAVAVSLVFIIAHKRTSKSIIRYEQPHQIRLPANDNSSIR